MRTLSPQTIIFSSRYLSIYHGPRISRFSTSPPPSSFLSRRHEEESRCVRVSVWWDFENCQLPAGANVFKVGQSITAAIRANGIRGPVQITAFGDMLQLSRGNQEALSATGINLTHIPHGGKNSADRSLLVDLMYWVSQNPPPAHLFLISGDRDFAGILHRLRMKNYNILLSSPETAPCVLCSAASIMWHWSALLKGENLTGKYFNQPPDGPYGSWYGHYRVLLEDPFAVAEQPASSRPEEVSELNSDLKIRPVPKAVVKHIRHILKSYPKGVSISELGSELRKSNVGIDKDFYGYKKFSRFLLSMPHILKIDFGNDGQLFVKGIAPKVPEPVESSDSSPGDIAAGSVANTEAPPIAISPKVNVRDNSSTKGMEENPMLPPNPELNVKKPPRKSKRPQMKTPLVEKVNNTDETGNHLHLSDGNNSKSEVGFFQRMRRKWFGGEDVDCEKNTSNMQEERSSGESSDEMGLKSTCESTDLAGPASFPSSEEAVMDDKLVEGGKSQDELSSRDPRFFKKIISWCTFWRNSSNSEISIDQSSENVNQVAIDSGRHEIFAKESFWKAMEEFIDTPPNGSVLVLQSRSREQMAENLQKQGPSDLKSLSQSDLLHLVDLLISEKKWVEEFSSQTYPFRLNRSSKNSATSSDTPNSNGLRSLFLSTTSPLNNKKQSSKSRNEILADCQNLVHDLLEKNPEGFNMGSFRNQFLDRYGYSLDIQKLGYQKLATLLQIIPGVKIESTYVVPLNGAKNDSLWAELGPVAKMGPTRKVNHGYEMLSDDCVSDSDDEKSLVGLERKGKVEDEDSSLLRILDSWYSAKEEAGKKEERESVDVKKENTEVNCGRKERNFKRYSFVSERVGDCNKDKVIDGILTSLKKSGESRMQA